MASTSLPGETTTPSSLPAGAAAAAGAAQAFISNLFTGKEGSGAPMASTSTSGGAPGDGASSLLSQWNTYSASATGPSASDRLLARAEEGSAAAQALVSSALARALAGASAAAGGAAAAGSAAFDTATAAVPSTTGVAYFAALLGSGALFLAIAFFVFLPMLVVAPAKFAACFSLGSGLVVAAPAALRGARAHLSHMLSEERRPLTAAYFGTLLLTLWASLGLHSYLLSLVACFGQVCALAYYAASYVPGGAAGMRAAGSVAASALGSVFSSK